MTKPLVSPETDSDQPIHICPGWTDSLDTIMKIPSPLPVLALASLIHAVPANAAEDAQQDLETIVVIAHRIPTSDPVLPVEVIRFEHHSPVGVEVLRQLPNFAISQSGSMGGLTQVRVRGSEANHTLVMIDGHRINHQRLKPVGRLAGNMYCHTADSYEMVRPVYNPDAQRVG